MPRSSVPSTAQSRVGADTTSARETLEHVGEAPRKRPRDRKQQIIRAARDLFVEHGYPNVSMAMIADAVGVTAGALYRHVKIKAELLTLVFKDSFAWLAESRLSTSFSSAVEYAIEQFVDHPYLPDLWINEAKYLPTEEQVELRRQMRDYAEHFVILLDGQNPKLNEDQRVLISWAILSLMSSVGRRAIRVPPSSRVEIIQRAVDAIVTTDISNVDKQLTSHKRVLEPNSMRERLLQAAFTEFGRVGYHETSITSVGAAAGVSGPNLYGYFASKADLLRAVYERAYHALWLGLDTSLSRARDAEDALNRLIKNYVGLSQYWPHPLEEPTGDDALDEFALEAQREYVGEWIALLRTVRPRLTVHEARLRVQIGLLLLADLYRVPYLRRHPAIEMNAAALVRAVLFC